MTTFLKSKAHTRVRQFKPMNVEDSSSRFIVSIVGVGMVAAAHIPGWDKEPAGSPVEVDNLDRLRKLVGAADNKGQAVAVRMAARKAAAATDQAAAGWDRTLLAGLDRTS